MEPVYVGEVAVGGGSPLALIAGPCVVEGMERTLRIAEEIRERARRAGIALVFKASYEKDNRSTIDGYRGPGLSRGLEVVRAVRERLAIPVISDVHRESDVDEAATVLDALQIPAFLCQQTSLLVKAGRSGRPVNIKKGPFMAPGNMSGPAGKVASTGNTRILLTERGSTFGYGGLVVDMSAIPIMRWMGHPVVFDVTHSVRVYGVPSHMRQGGRPELIRELALAGVAAGCDALFVETHPEPAEASCDGACMLPLAQLSSLLEQALDISAVVRSSGRSQPCQ